MIDRLVTELLKIRLVASFSRAVKHRLVMDLAKYHHVKSFDTTLQCNISTDVIY